MSANPTPEPVLAKAEVWLLNKCSLCAYLPLHHEERDGSYQPWHFHEVPAEDPSEMPHAPAQEGRGAAGTAPESSDRGTGVSESHARPEAIPTDLFESNPNVVIRSPYSVQFEPEPPEFPAAFIPNEALPHLAAFVNALKPAHLREAAASIRAIAEHMPDTAAALRPGITYAAALIEHTATDLEDTE